MARIPLSTYRLQLNGQFTFSDACEIVDYLEELGIGDVYLSPFLKARPGSPHGYDVTDHSEVNPEIGTEEELERLARRVGEAGMGVLADVVPNHMSIAQSANPRWQEVLEDGPSSTHAGFFDIDWLPPRENMAHKVLLPVLGDQYGRVLENGEIQVEYTGGGFQARYHETVLPLAPRSWPALLEAALEQARAQLGTGHEQVLELESIITALSYLPPRTETDEARLRERQREKQIIRRRLADLTAGSAEVREAVGAAVREVNGRRGEPRSFDRLESLLGDQAWRVSYWRVAADEINYRRFFDINELAAIRVEDSAVFAAVHERIIEFIRRGWIHGLRVDHPDGLFDPLRYFADLQAAAAAALRGRGLDPGTAEERPFYLVAEKIVTGDEELRRNWAIHGTTGYGFLNFLNGLFVDPDSRRQMGRIYRQFTGAESSIGESIYESKSLILRVALSSELNVLARRLDRICQQHRHTRDFTLESLRFALREIVACFPVYRTYVRADQKGADPEDRRHVLAAVNEAKRRNPATSESIFDVIASILTLEDPEGITAEQRAERRLFVMRLQQVTGPAMAKGVEDTAFYRHHPLASQNEVGGDPHQSGVSPFYFHRKNRVRQAEWPHAMLATSTHDSKRSEDVRARINVLSEMPEQWHNAILHWRPLNRRHKTMVGGHEAPDRNAEYLLYQTLVGTWPLEAEREGGWPAYVKRIQDYMDKALLEAKIHTSWINPNEAYHAATRGFIERILDPAPGNEFVAKVGEFVGQLVYPGMLNSLSQVLLKTASPGVPDFYQGSEIWNLSLVDPDNRRPVNYAERRRLLASLRECEREGQCEFLERLAKEPNDGRLKLWVTQRSLLFRRRHRALFEHGTYTPVTARGKRREHVIAFGRAFERQAVLAVAGRFFHRLGAVAAGGLTAELWEDTELVLPRGMAGNRFRDALTGREVDAEGRERGRRIRLREILAPLPVALLERM